MTEEMEEKRMEFKSLAGITNISRPVMLSRQNIVLFANGSCIQSICLSTGNLLGSYDQHKDLVTCILHDEDYAIEMQNDLIPATEKKNIVISASLDGDIRIWNLTTCTTYVQTRLADPVFKLKLVPTYQLIDPIELEQQQQQKKSSNKSMQLDLLVTTAHQRVDGNVSTGNGKVKIQYEVNAFDLETLTKNDHLSTIVMHHHNMEYISVNAAANNRNATQQMITAVVFVKNKKLMFKFLSAGSEGKKPAQVDVGQEILCLAVNNSTGTVAVGLQYGEILVLHNVDEYLRSSYNNNEKIGNKDAFLTKTTMHWHAHGVLTVAFSDDGKFLYSGGEESVLVAWNITRLTKNFLPRLGAPLCHLVTSRDAAKAAKVLTTTLDNSLRLVNTANMEVEWFWQSAYMAQNKYNLSALYNGLTNANFRISLLKSLLPFRLTDQQSEKTWKCSIQVDPYSGNLLSNGHPGQLQSFDLINGVVRKNVKVTYFNRVSRKDSAEHLYVPSIMKHVYDSSGKFLVTIDIRKGEEMEEQGQGEVSLKFWEYNVGSDSYELSAQMENPHGCSAMITDVKIVVVLPTDSGVVSDPHAALNANHGSGDLMVLVATSSDDGVVKVWRGNYHNTVDTDNVTHKTQARNTSNQHNTSSSAGSNELHGLKIRWKCAYSFQYRHCPVTAIAWSNDASSLVVCHENVISFWDPINVAMKKSITTVGSKKVLSIQVVEPRADTALGGGCGDVYLTVITSSALTVYSLLSMKILWSYNASEITSSAVAADERFVAIVQNGQATSSIHQEGWIGIATSRVEMIAPKQNIKLVPAEEDSSKKKKGSRGKGKKSSEENDLAGATTGESEAESVGSSRPTKVVHNEILVFSPLSPAPLSQVSVHSRVISLEFLARKPLSSSSSTNGVSGLAGVTADSELFIVSAQMEDTNTNKSSKKVALVKNAVLPSISNNVIITGNSKLLVNKKDSEGSAPLFNTAVVGRTQTNKTWLQELFPENTEDLPRPSDIARDFMKHLSQSCASNSHNHISSNKQSQGKLSKIQEEALGDTVIQEKQSSHPEAKSPIDLDAITSILQQKFATLLERHIQGTHTNTTSVASAPVVTTTPAKSSRARAPSESEDDVSVMSETPGRQTRRSSRASLSNTVVVPAPIFEEEEKATTVPTAITTNATEDEKEAPLQTRTRRTRQSMTSDISASESENESVMSEASKTPKRGRKSKAAITPSMEPVPEEQEEESSVMELAEAPTIRKSSRKSKANEAEPKSAEVVAVVEESEANKTRNTRKRKPSEDLGDSVATIGTTADSTEKRSTRRKSTK